MVPGHWGYGNEWQFAKGHCTCHSSHARGLLEQSAEIIKAFQKPLGALHCLGVPDPLLCPRCFFPPHFLIHSPPQVCVIVCLTCPSGLSCTEHLESCIAKIKTNLNNSSCYSYGGVLMGGTYQLFQPMVMTSSIELPKYIVPLFYDTSGYFWVCSANMDKWNHWDPERLCDLPEVTQQMPDQGLNWLNYSFQWRGTQWFTTLGERTLVTDSETDQSYYFTTHCVLSQKPLFISSGIIGCFHDCIRFPFTKHLVV